MSDNINNQGEAERPVVPTVEQQDTEMTSASDAPQTAEQRAAERRERRARHKEAYDLNRPIIDVGNKISLKAITCGVDGEFAGFRAVNHTGGRQTDFRGTIGNQAIIQTKNPEEVQRFVGEQMKDSEEGQNFVVSVGKFSDADVQQSKTKQHVLGYSKTKARTISERDDDAMDVDGHRHQKRLRGGSYQTDAPSQGDPRRKRRGHRGQGTSKRTQSQAPASQQRQFPASQQRQLPAVQQNQARAAQQKQLPGEQQNSSLAALQKQGLNNYKWANPKPNNNFRNAPSEPQLVQPVIGATPGGAPIYGEPILGMVARSQSARFPPPAKNTASGAREKRPPIPGSRPAPREKRPPIPGSRPAPKVAPKATPAAGVIVVEDDEEEGDYPTPVVGGYELPLEYLQYLTLEPSMLEIPIDGDDDGFLGLVETDFDELDGVAELFGQQ